MTAASSRVRIAAYGEIDLNLVDGSSVWMQSVCQVLCSLGGVDLTLLLRRSVEPDRRFLLEDLEGAGSVEIVDPGLPGRLDPDEALDLLEELDRKRSFDLLLLRGSAVLAEAAKRPTLAGRLWPYVMTDRGLADDAIRALVSCSHRVLCQTDAVADELRSIAPEVDGSLLVLPPMIPDSPEPSWGRNDETRALRLVYSGKLAPEYCWLETVEAFRALRSAQSGAELHVIGDKVHRPPDHPAFHNEAMRALRETEGLQWYGAVPRAEVHSLLADCDIALSIRDPSVEGAREISTKVLEYGAAGLPVVLNRAPVYERLLGTDYPYFIDSPDEARSVLTGPVLDGEQREQAAAACLTASREFTFQRVAERLAQHLPAVAASASQDNGAPETALLAPSFSPAGHQAQTSSPGKRVLAAGHDLKFLSPIREAIASAGGILAEDVWQNHTEHSERASREALEQADVILCEWCLGNAVWYSRNVKPGQRLVIRMHRMEVFTDHPAGVDIDRVDRVVCVSQHIADEAVARFGWDLAKLQVINNSVDVDRFRRPKLEGSEHTLAMIGYVPIRKRLDRALDILEELRRTEASYRMLFIGHPPSEFDWVVRRAEEVDFFRRSYARVQESPLLRGAVHFLPFSDDLPSFFQRVGFIISTSDSEGHQVALAEAAASGSVPVILNQPGADTLYPPRWVHATTSAAASAALALEGGDLEAEQVAAADHTNRWSPERILPQWTEVLGLRSVGGPRQVAASETDANL